MENQVQTISSSLAVRDTSKALGQSLCEPQKAKAISAMVAGLAAQFHRPDLTEAQSAQVFHSFIDDLADFAVADIEEGVRQYRRDPAAKFFPTSGQLRLRAAKANEERIKASKFRQPLREARPLMWWTKPKALWKSHWREDEIPQASQDEAFDPERNKPKRSAQEILAERPKQ